MYNVQIIEFGGWRRGISEASTTLNARALKARSISPCIATTPAGECPPNFSLVYRNSVNLLW